MKNLLLSLAFLPLFVSNVSAGVQQIAHDCRAVKVGATVKIHPPQTDWSLPPNPVAGTIDIRMFYLAKDGRRLNPRACPDQWFIGVVFEPLDGAPWLDVIDDCYDAEYLADGITVVPWCFRILLTNPGVEARYRLHLSGGQQWRKPEFFERRYIFKTHP